MDEKPTKYRLPYPCDDFPKFDTLHEAASLIAEYQDRGAIKKCSHLRIEKVGGYWDPTEYLPACSKDSFEREMAGRYLFWGCPKNCLFYRAAWKGKIESWLRERWWPLRRGIVGIAQWYASLSTPAQVILALVLLAMAGAAWRETILEGLRIIFGK